MIGPVIGPARTPHLVSALVACMIVIAILCAGRLLAIQLERKTVHWIAPRDFLIKNQGLAFERRRAHTGHLVLYGSSELIDPIPNRASDFFSSAPTGFKCAPSARRERPINYFAEAGRAGVRVAWPKGCDLSIRKLVSNA